MFNKCLSGFFIWIECLENIKRHELEETEIQPKKEFSKNQTRKIKFKYNYFQKIGTISCGKYHPIWSVIFKYVTYSRWCENTMSYHNRNYDVESNVDNTTSMKFPNQQYLYTYSLFSHDTLIPLKTGYIKMYSKNQKQLSRKSICCINGWMGCLVFYW